VGRRIRGEHWCRHCKDSTVPYCTARHSTALQCAYCTVVQWTALHCIVLTCNGSCTVFYCFAVDCRGHTPRHQAKHTHQRMEHGQNTPHPHQKRGHTRTPMRHSIQGLSTPRHYTRSPTRTPGTPRHSTRSKRHSTQTLRLALTLQGTHGKAAWMPAPGMEGAEADLPMGVSAYQGQAGSGAGEGKGSEVRREGPGESDTGGEGEGLGSVFKRFNVEEESARRKAAPVSEKDPGGAPASYAECYPDYNKGYAGGSGGE